VTGVGSTLSGYELVARVAHGGMATLYLARRAGAAGFSRYLAVKVVHPHLADDERFVGMFIDEAKLSARIQDPNVVHVEELGEVDGTYFIVMEYVHGCPLSKLIRQFRKLKRRPSVELMVYVAMKVADGLHAAHETTDAEGRPLNIVHRDVSPQNVLLDYKGHVKLIDFGVAKARGRQATLAGSLKGKLRYMPPEQALSQHVDRRSDIYSLGIVVWEMLTLRRLFDAETDHGLLDQVRAPKIGPPSMYTEGIDPALDEAVMMALSMDPEKRPPTAKHFRRMLVDACPGALRVEGSDLAQLIRAVMGDYIREQERRLPFVSAPSGRASSSDNAAVIEIDVDVDEVLMTMTQSSESLAGKDPGSGGSSVSEVRSDDSSGSGSAPSAPRPISRDKPPKAAQPARPAAAESPALGKPEPLPAPAPPSPAARPAPGPVAAARPAAAAAARIAPRPVAPPRPAAALSTPQPAGALPTPQPQEFPLWDKPESSPVPQTKPSPAMPRPAADIAVLPTKITPPAEAEPVEPPNPETSQELSGPPTIPSPAGPALAGVLPVVVDAAAPKPAPTPAEAPVVTQAEPPAATQALDEEPTTIGVPPHMFADQDAGETDLPLVWNRWIPRLPPGLPPWLRSPRVLGGIAVAAVLMLVAAVVAAVGSSTGADEGAPLATPPESVSTPAGVPERSPDAGAPRTVVERVPPRHEPAVTAMDTEHPPEVPEPDTSTVAEPGADTTTTTVAGQTPAPPDEPVHTTTSRGQPRGMTTGTAGGLPLVDTLSMSMRTGSSRGMMTGTAGGLPLADDIDL